MTDKTNPEKVAKELTMLLINELDEEGYIRQGSHRSKSVAITDEGMKLSRELLAKYNISDWK